jgi:WD40 repeat protein
MTALIYEPDTQDDQHILTATMEKTIRTYDPAKPDAELTSLAGHEKPIKVAAFYKGNDTILSAGDDKTVRCVT